MTSSIAVVGLQNFLLACAGCKPLKPSASSASQPHADVPPLKLSSFLCSSLLTYPTCCWPPRRLFPSDFLVMTHLWLLTFKILLCVCSLRLFFSCFCFFFFCESSAGLTHPLVVFLLPRQKWVAMLGCASLVAWQTRKEFVVGQTDFKYW